MWNWKENIKGAIEVIECKISEMNRSPYLTKVRNQINQIIGKGDSLIMGDFTVGNITFTLANSTFFPNWDVKKTATGDKKSFLDANLITLYNGNGHIITKVEEVKEKVIDKVTKNEIEVIRYKIIIDDTKAGYLNDVLK